MEAMLSHIRDIMSLVFNQCLMASRWMCRLGLPWVHVHGGRTGLLICGGVGRKDGSGQDDEGEEESLRWWDAGYDEGVGKAG